MLLLKAVDVVWLFALAVLSCALVLAASLARPIAAFAIPFLPHALVLPTGGAALATTAVGTYLTGLRLKDRATAITAGLLVATSIALAVGAAAYPLALILAALAVFSFFCFAMGWTIASLCVAGVAVFAQSDMLLLGAMLMIVALCQRRRLAGAGALAFLALSGAAFGLWLAPWHGAVSLWLWFAAHGQPAEGQIDRALVEASLAPVLWFLFPYLAEWSRPENRAKWWASGLWSLATLLFTFAYRHQAGAVVVLPMLPIVSLMAAAGIARLLPAFAGEFARPLSRYAAAVAAVGALIAARAALEWAAVGGRLS